jgi:hypothetical protein
MLIFYFISPLAASTEAEWTILFVMQGDNNLSSAMYKNIKTLKKIGSTPDVNLLVQWDEPLSKTTWRYKIDQNKLVDDASLPQEMGADPESELVDAARWAFTNYKAKKQALILWNHGSGVLDEARGWEKMRGILYDFSSRKCLTNTGLLHAMQKIKQDVLNNKALDFFGMDACLMAMVEVAYQIKDFATLLVASENIEYTPGWDYKTIIRQLINNAPRFEGRHLADLVVKSFRKFNIKRNSNYTQSAIMLDQIPALKDNLNAFALACLGQQDALLKKYVAQARTACAEFDNGNFMDLYDFYQKCITICTANRRTAIYPQIVALAADGCALIDQAIAVHTKGSTYRNVRGLSIYFPRGKELHASYNGTLFAQETVWPLFLQNFQVQ